MFDICVWGEEEKSCPSRAGFFVKTKKLPQKGNDFPWYPYAESNRRLRRERATY